MVSPPDSGEVSFLAEHVDTIISGWKDGVVKSSEFHFEDLTSLQLPSDFIGRNVKITLPGVVTRTQSRQGFNVGRKQIIP